MVPPPPRRPGAERGEVMGDSTCNHYWKGMCKCEEKGGEADCDNCEYFTTYSAVDELTALRAERDELKAQNNSFKAMSIADTERICDLKDKLDAVEKERDYWVEMEDKKDSKFHKLKSTVAQLREALKEISAHCGKQKECGSYVKVDSIIQATLDAEVSKHE